MASKLKKRAAQVIHEIHVFLGTGVRKDGAQVEWTPGACYSLLIFTRQPEGEAPDEPLARKSASAAGWTSIKLERSKRLPVTSPPEGDALRAAFREALTDGAAVMAYIRPVK
jgi:hypothetical protein